MMQTFSTLSGWQDSFLLKLALQPIGNQSPISHRQVAEDFRAKVFKKLMGDRLKTVWPSVGVTASFNLCMLKRMAVTDFDGRPCCELCKAFTHPLQPLCNCQLF